MRAGIRSAEPSSEVLKSHNNACSIGGIKILSLGLISHLIYGVGPKEHALATLKNATRDDLSRLLDLFPLSTLKEEWTHLKGTKEEICLQIASQPDEARIVKFIMANFTRCRLHTYIFHPRTEDHKDLEAALKDVDSIGPAGGGDRFFLGEAKFTVLVRNPDFKQVEVSLLWPMRVQYLKGATLINFIVLERDVKTLFDGEVLNVRRQIEEKSIVEAIRFNQYAPLDLNKGVKALWAQDLMDAFKTKFKKTRSTTTESMDKEKGIKATDPELYKDMQLRPMFETMFRVAPKAGSAVEVFQVNPTDGIIKMTRYTERPGDSNELVGKILQANSQ